MSVVMQGVTSTAAGASTANVLTGQAYERAPFSGGVRFYVTGDSSGEQRVTVIIGGRLIMQEAPLSRQARPPLIPDDFLIAAPVRRGEQIVLNVRNTGAGSNNLFWRVELAGR